jgi:superfamily II DNA/RNA helicase
MALNNQEIHRRLSHLTEPEGRDRLLARGLARSLIWREGQLPPNSPMFAESLSYDLESHAFQILELALSVTGQDRFEPIILDAYRVAAEELEAIVRRGDPKNPYYGFLMVVSAAAYQLARLGARSYVVLPFNLRNVSLSIAERLLAFLLRRDFENTTIEILDWASNASSGAQAIQTRLDQTYHPADLGDDSGPDLMASRDEGLAWLLTDNYIRAISHLDLALRVFDIIAFETVKQKLLRGQSTAAEANHVPQWWIHRLTICIIDDLWDTLIWNRLPRLDGEAAAADEWNRLRLNYVRTKIAKPRTELEFWPSQLEAAKRSVEHSSSMLLALPTSSGKTKIAELCILRALSLGKRIFYITPLRALSAQVERILASTFCPLGFSVSSLYGASGVSKIDIDIAQSDHIVVATPEKLDYVLRNEPNALNDVGLVVLDEGHMIGTGVREIRYETLVQRLLSRDDASERRLICLSAIFESGEAFDDFTSWISRGDSQAAIRSNWRPTRQRAALCVWEGTSARLRFYVEKERPFVPKYLLQKSVKGRRKRQFPSDKNELVVALADRLVREDHTVLVYCPQRRSVESTAKRFLGLIEREAIRLPVPGKRELQEAMRIGHEWLGDTHPAVRCLEVGIAVHHGTLPRPFLSAIEKLINARQVRLVVASPTLAQGLDLSCSALIFQSLHRNRAVIPSVEFANVIGRIGRAFVDIEGLSVFPIFEKTPRRVQYRINEFLTLWNQSRSRDLESGLLLLVAKIIGALSSKLGVSATTVVERVARIDFDWQQAVNDAPAATYNEEADQIDLDRLISQLDEALLTMITPDVEASQLGQLLDDALRDSYWERRLARIEDPTTAAQQREVLRGRARWIWSRSDTASRRGFSTAGIGLSTGELLLNNLESLAVHLKTADEAIVAGDVDSALDSITPVVQTLAKVPPFEMNLPDDWQLLLRRWLLGEPIWGSGDSAKQRDWEFISEGLVYRTVWGIEAIRSLAIAKDVLETSFTAVALTDSLTFGCYASFGRWLLRKGLSSRRLATEISKVLRDFDLSWLQPGMLLNHLIEEQTIEQLYTQNPEKLEVWQSFLAQEETIVRGAWGEQRASGTIEVKNTLIEETSTVRIVRKMDDVATIYSLDLDPLADVKMPSEKYFSGHVHATLSPEGELKIVRYGPSM